MKADLIGIERVIPSALPIRLAKYTAIDGSVLRTILLITIQLAFEVILSEGIVDEIYFAFGIVESGSILP